MKYLIVGIGNIGLEYEETRHNIGFKILDYLASSHEASFDSKRLAYYTDFKFKGRHFHLIKPTTYVNRSGRSVKYWMDQLKIDPENLLVVVDDLALPFGVLRLKKKGSDGGHNGLKDINIYQGNKYARLRFGIGNDFGRGRQVNYVLGTWNEDELATLDDRVKTAAEAVLSFATIGVDRTMNIFNTKEEKQ